MNTHRQTTANTHPPTNSSLITNLAAILLMALTLILTTSCTPPAQAEDLNMKQTISVSTKGEGEKNTCPSKPDAMACLKQNGFKKVKGEDTCDQHGRIVEGVKGRFFHAGHCTKKKDGKIICYLNSFKGWDAVLECEKFPVS